MITPADSPSSPGDYAAVTPHGRGPAPYDLQAPLDTGSVQAAFDRSVRDAGAGVLYPESERQADTRRLLMSPPGYADFDILGGTTAGWPADITPPDSVDNGGYGGA